MFALGVPSYLLLSEFAMRLTTRTLAALFAASVVARAQDLDACPGYEATNVTTTASTLTATLNLAGTACNVYGTDVPTLKLEVLYETDTRLHIKITDPAHDRYEIPESVFPRPSASPDTSSTSSAIQFNYTASPFSFSILRASSGEALFSTGSHPLIFEPQYLRLKTDLPADANIYGLGEHTDTFRLPTSNYTRTFWSRDAYGVPNGTNLYSNHPVYFEHRASGSHGVFLLNSNGMDVKIDDADPAGTTLEYNTVGGVLDLYFLAGSTSDPVELARQYAQLVGTPAEVPYWSFGFHQCRFGYQNYIDVAGVIMNYSAAGIPLETMWTDIDYMHERRVFTMDDEYFPKERMQEIVHYLHAHDQHFILMVDPAVAYLPEQGYSPYDRGTAQDVWLQLNGTSLKGVVWPGVTVYPDWFNPKTADYWTNEFKIMFDPTTGIDVDGAWIDMNEPSSFCVYPCTDPAAQAIEQGLPPNRTTAPPDPTAPILDQPGARTWADVSINTPIVVDANNNHRRNTNGKRAYHGPEESLLFPQYNINNAAGVLSSKTADVDGTHSNGLYEYDTHNLFGTMMSTTTRGALEARRPGLRTFVITRSTFAGAGAHVGKWLGDNFSTWWHYRVSVAGMLGFASVYQLPMVGSDICGYAENTTETLCARWAMLGAFYPFMRNHNADDSIPQEFYRWPLVAAAARNAIEIRYRLLDYIYTAFHLANTDGTPVLNPIWYKYPQDSNTFGIDLQFFFGPSLLVSPVTDENATSVSIYLPSDTFYDFATGARVPAAQTGEWTTVDANFTTIPLHVRGGAVLPLRAAGARTTTALRGTDFQLLVAPDAAGSAAGALYVDDGVSVAQAATTNVAFAYAAGKLQVSGSFGYATGVKVASVRVLGVDSAPSGVSVTEDGGSAQDAKWRYDAGAGALDVDVGVPLDHGFVVRLS